jgi:hypothetical protein
MKRNKQSPKAQLNSTMASCCSLTEGKVAWVTQKSFLLSTIPISDILLAIWSMHHSLFIVLPSLHKSRDDISFKRGAVTPRVTEIIIKSLKLQLSPKARANQVVEV